MGVVPCGVDVHRLKCLLKAWFRELRTGVLDSLTPDQVMNCNTEEECTQHVSSLPPTEAALLDWAINLMAVVVEHEDHNKMKTRNIAMVFTPNMTQMADPLTCDITPCSASDVSSQDPGQENASRKRRCIFLSSCSESSIYNGNPRSSNINNETCEKSSS